MKKYGKVAKNEYLISHGSGYLTAYSHEWKSNDTSLIDEFMLVLFILIDALLWYAIVRVVKDDMCWYPSEAPTRLSIQSAPEAPLLILLNVPCRNNESTGHYRFDFHGLVFKFGL